MTLQWPASAGLAGIDEAGRGPLAGPVVAAAVILPVTGELSGLNDSKALSAPSRESLARQIRLLAKATGIGWADALEIDALNILEATHLAMRRALLALSHKPQAVVVDGNRLPELSGLWSGVVPSSRAVVRGDATHACIAAASILAKTWRDAYMRAADRRFPQYGFASHKGYGCVRHVEALGQHGPCVLHRRSFQPVRAVLDRSPHRSSVAQ
jgi:ribonuclease HII